MELPDHQGRLIYVIDLRDGLYILEHAGRFEREVKHIGFLEGNDYDD